MKLNCTLLFFILLFSKIFASPSDSVRISRCYYHTDDFYNGYTYTIDRFDSAGHLISTNIIGEYHEQYVGYTFTRERTTYLLNSSGYPVNALNETWDSSSWHMVTRHGYAYDISSNLIADTFYQATGPYYVINYGWDINHDTTLIEHSYWNGSIFTYNDSTSMQFDVNGRLLTRTKYEVNSVNSIREVYTYDVLGNIASYTNEYGAAPTYVPSKQFLYQYTSFNVLQAYSERAWNATDSSLHFIDTIYHSFNANNHVVNTMHTKINTSITDSTYQTNIYDMNDSVSQINIFNYRFPPFFSDTFKVTITRNANGFVDDSLVFHSVNGVFKNYYSYRYDNSGIPLQRIMYGILCDTIACTDTVESTIFTYSATGEFRGYLYDHNDPLQIQDWYGDGILYDDSMRIVNRTYDDYQPGEHDHQNSIWHYDASGNNTYYYHSGSGSLGIPYITECFYEYFPDTGALNVQVILDVDTICSNTTLPAFILITGGTPPYQISWNDSTGIIDAQLITPLIIPDSTFLYQVNVSDALGHTDSATFSIATINLNVSLGSDTIICTQNTLTLSAPPGNQYYTWSTGSAGQSIQLISPVMDSVLVWLEVSDYNDCKTRDSMIVAFAICNGINETSSAHFTLFSDENNIRIVYADMGIADYYKIYNMNGEKIFDYKINSPEIIIPTGKLSSGIYILNTGKQGVWSENTRLLVH